MKTVKLSFIAITIIAIVGLTMSLKKRGSAYCASLVKNNGCSVVVAKIETPSGGPSATYDKYSSWDGWPANCLNNRCETQTIFYNEP